MSKTPTPQLREAASAGAILWARSITRPVAPDELGGQTLDEQERIVRERISKDGLALDRTLIAVGTTAGSSDDRLRVMLRILEEAPIRHVYISGAVYANDSEDDVMKHHLMLLMKDSRLTLCEDE